LISGVPVDPWLVGLHTGLYNETYTVGLWLKTNSKHQGRKKQGHCVQGDYKHLEIKPISPSGVFCLGVYYTRDNTYKDCYIRQGRSQ
jgi:hypothetical protein